MRRNMFLLVVLVVVLGSLIPTMAAAEEPKWSIAALLGPQDNPYWIASAAGAEAAAAAFNVELTILTPNSESDVTLQIGQIEDRIAKGDDAIVIAALDTKALIPAIEQANAAGILIVMVDKGSEGGKIASSIMTDNPAAAKEGARFLAELIGGKGKVLLLEGVAGASAAIDRRAGAHEGYAEYPDIQLISLSANWETGKAQSVTEDVLTAHPDLAGVQASNDMMAMGAYGALSAAGLADTVPLIGFDAIPPALDMVADGRMVATVAQFPTRMTFIAIQNAVMALEGKEVPEIVDSGALVVTLENVYAFKEGLYGN
jgi:ribose transport system substrate-binding protein